MHDSGDRMVEGKSAVVLTRPGYPDVPITYWARVPLEHE